MSQKSGNFSPTQRPFIMHVDDSASCQRAVVWTCSSKWNSTMCNLDFWIHLPKASEERFVALEHEVLRQSFMNTKLNESVALYFYPNRQLSSC